MIRVGLNGFGRIGRVVTRILSTKRKFKLVLINEVDDDVKNLAYLFKYDSIYGKFNGKVSNKGKNILINKNEIKIFSKNNNLADGTYKPIFFNDMYKSSSARQQFKFIRYIYDSDKKSWVISETGPFAAIIFKPANAYLTADKNFEFILKTLENIDYNNDPEPIIQWLMLPPWIWGLLNLQ